MKWDEPFQKDARIRSMERAISETACKVAYVRSQSILSADDDQYRLSSALSEEMGFPRFNIANKAFGPVSTNVVDLISGVVLGM